MNAPGWNAIANPFSGFIWSGNNLKPPKVISAK